MPTRETHRTQGAERTRDRRFGRSIEYEEIHLRALPYNVRPHSTPDMGYANVYNLGSFKEWSESGGATDPVHDRGR